MRKKLTKKKPAPHWRAKIDHREKSAILFAYTLPVAARYLGTQTRKLDISRSDYLTGLILAHRQGKLYKPRPAKKA